MKANATLFEIFKNGINQGCERGRCVQAERKQASVKTYEKSVSC